MGVNNPKFWDKAEVDNYTTSMNERRATLAQKHLRETAQAQLRGEGYQISPMPGAEKQDDAIMEVEIGEANFLTDIAHDLGRQHVGTLKMISLGTCTGDADRAMALAIKGRDQTFKEMEMKEPGGTVITVDVTNKYEALAKEGWKEEGVTQYIDPRIVPLDGKGGGGACQVLKELLADPANHNSFDMVFIDHAKSDYKNAYELALQLVRPGGKILLDNTLWSGRVTQPNAENKFPDTNGNTDAIRDVNETIMNDPRVKATLLNCDDGIMIATKEGNFWQWKASQEKARALEPYAGI